MSYALDGSRMRSPPTAQVHDPQARHKVRPRFQKSVACPAALHHSPPTMKSMTGYGRGEGAGGGFKVTAELSSVNRRQAEIAIFLPRELESLEPQVRDAINRVIARGRVSARLKLHAATGDSSRALGLDVPLARAYAKELRRLARELNIEEPLTLDALLRAPGVLQADEQSADPERFWPAVQQALSQALSRLLRMREREGKHLAHDLKGRIRVLRATVRRIHTLAPAVLQRYRQQLGERIRNAGLPLTPADDERLLKEIVFFADRSDLSEELTRLESHFRQFDDCLKSDEPVGRTLDFLAQEMNREVNTLGAKANDAAISREVVVLKTELEKFREQVQNVE